MSPQLKGQKSVCNPERCRTPRAPQRGLTPLVVMATGLRQKRVIFTVKRERDQTVSNRTSAPLALKECFFEVVNQ